MGFISVYYDDGIMRKDVVIQLDAQSVLSFIEENPAYRLSNQGIQTREVHEWENLRFGSPPEIAIAKALDKAGVLFLTNSPVRLGKPDKRKKLFPDFLVCQKGKWE